MFCVTRAKNHPLRIAALLVSCTFAPVLGFAQAPVATPAVATEAAAPAAAPVDAAAAVPLPTEMTATFVDLNTFIATPSTLVDRPPLAIRPFARDLAILGGSSQSEQQAQFLAALPAVFNDTTVAVTTKVLMATGLGQAFAYLSDTKTDYADRLQLAVLQLRNAPVSDAFAKASGETLTAATNASGAAGAAQAAGISNNAAGNGQTGQTGEDITTVQTSGTFSVSRGGGSTLFEEANSPTGGG